MSIRISNLRVSIDEPEAALPAQVAQALGISPTEVRAWRILRKSLDVRDKRDLQFVYNAEVIVPEDEADIVAKVAPGRPERVELFHEIVFEMPSPGEVPLRHRRIALPLRH